jgi:hypothetical protein
MAENVLRKPTHPRPATKGGLACTHLLAQSPQCSVVRSLQRHAGAQHASGRCRRAHQRPAPPCTAQSFIQHSHVATRRSGPVGFLLLRTWGPWT